MNTSDPLTFILTRTNRQTIFLSRLKLRHLVILVTGLPMLAISMVSKEPTFAGSLFIALIAMVLDQQLNQLIRRLNSRITFRQVSVAITVAAVFVSWWLNPVNATPGKRFAIPIQQASVVVAETIGIKLVIVALNLLLMAVIFYAVVQVHHHWIKKAAR